MSIKEFIEQNETDPRACACGVVRVSDLEEYLKDKVVLPKEPTKEIIEAMQSEIIVQHGIIYGFTYAYRAMLKESTNER